MFRKPISTRWQVVLGVLSVLTLAAAYTLVCRTYKAGNPNGRAVPSWGELYEDGVVRSLTKRDLRGELWLANDCQATFFRLFVSMSVATVASIFLGLMMGCYPPIEAFLLPPLSFLAKIPATAMLAVFFVMAGTDFNMYLAMLCFGLIPTLTQAIYHSAKEDVPQELISKASTLGASQAECIWDVIYKHTLPKVLEFVRLQVGPALVYLLAAEYAVGHAGFGFRLKIQQRLLEMSHVYVYLAYLGIAGFLIDLAIIFTLRKLCPWFGR